MRKAKVVILIAVTVVLIPASSLPLTIAGLAYYSNNAYGLGNFRATPIDDALVTLFKWDAEAGAWDDITSVYTEAGYYHFDDVGGLGVGWWKIKVNATGKTPPDHEAFDIQERVAKNVLRPQGIPDAGIIRVDVIHVMEYSFLVEEPEAPWYRGFEGHFVRFFDGTNEMPNLGGGEGGPPVHDATCPAGENELHFHGCCDGHLVVENL